MQRVTLWRPCPGQAPYLVKGKPALALTSCAVNDSFSLFNNVRETEHASRTAAAQRWMLKLLCAWWAGFMPGRIRVCLGIDGPCDCCVLFHASTPATCVSLDSSKPWPADPSTWTQVAHLLKRACRVLQDPWSIERPCIFNSIHPLNRAQVSLAFR